MFFLLQITLSGVSVPALAQDDEYPALIAKTQTALTKGELDIALALATRAIESDPNQIEAWLTRARVYDALGNYSRAITDYSEAIKSNSMSATAWQRRGEA